MTHWIQKFAEARCGTKQAFRKPGKADEAAMKASFKTGPLIIPPGRDQLLLEASIRDGAFIGRKAGHLTRPANKLPGSNILCYGCNGMSPGTRLEHWTVVAFAMSAAPVIRDLESQETSTALPLITVGGFCDPMEMVEGFVATRPPC